MVWHSTPCWPVSQMSRPAWMAGRDSSAQLILTTWPPFLHSCGPRPLAGAMLQFDT